MDPDELHRASYSGPSSASPRARRAPCSRAAAPPLEGGILGVLLHAALRRARDDAPPLQGEGHHLPVRADGDDVAPSLLVRVALARVRAGAAPPRLLLRAFLRLSARQASAVLPSDSAEEDAPPLEGGVLVVLLHAALRRARDDAPPLHGEGYLLPVCADGDEVATSILVRVALARVRARACAALVQAAAQDQDPTPTPPRPPLEEMDLLLFNALLHRARRWTSPPTGIFFVRLLLRLPPHQARRLLPPPACLALAADSDSSRPTLAAVLLYAGKRWLEAALPPSTDGLLVDLVRSLHPLVQGLLPPPRDGDHATVLYAFYQLLATSDLTVAPTCQKTG